MVVQSGSLATKNKAKYDAPKRKKVVSWYEGMYIFEAFCSNPGTIRLPDASFARCIVIFMATARKNGTVFYAFTK